MTSTIFDRVVDHLRSACGSPPDDSDARLLARFRDSRDPLAFGRLVEKYSVLVWGACRRGVARPSDEEDAFQATFLSLVRQIDRLDIDRPLGPWLYAVAWRVARKTRTRSRGEAELLGGEPAENAPGATTQLMSREALRVIDEEIQRLPEPLREPLILCCLEGLGRDEAAVSIGCTPLAVKSRLERARGVLRERLSRRGIDLPVAFVLLHLTDLPAGAALRQLVVQMLGKSVSPLIQRLSIGPSLVTGKLVTTGLAWAMVGMLTVCGAWAISAQRAPQKRDGDKGKPAEVAETSAVLQDRFGDPLPEGAVRRFGTTRFRCSSPSDCLFFSRDGKHIVADSGYSEFVVFDAKSGEPRNRIQAEILSGFAASADGRLIVAGPRVKIWDLETGKLVREWGEVSYPRLAISPDGTRIVGVTKEHVAHLFDATEGKKIRQWTVADAAADDLAVKQVEFTPDGKSVAMSVTRTSDPKPNEVPTPLGVQFWDVEKGERLPFAIGREAMRDQPFRILPRSNQLVYLGQDGSVRFIDLKKKEEARSLRLREERDTVTGVAFSADEKRVAVYGYGHDVRILDASDGTEIRRFERNDYQQVALSADGSTFAQGDASCVRVWDVATGRELLAEAGPRSPTELSLSPDAKTLVGRETKADREFRWDLASGACTIHDGGGLADDSKWQDRDPTRRAAFQYRIWEKDHYHIEVRSLDGRKLLGKARTPYSSDVRFANSPDGECFAASFGDVLWVWNPKTQRQPHEIKLQNFVGAVALLFGHDGRKLFAPVAGSNGRADEIRVWQAETGKQLLKIEMGKNTFNPYSGNASVLLTVDDRFLVTASFHSGKATTVWDLEAGRAATTLVDPTLNEAKKGLGDEKGAADPQSVPRVTDVALSADDRFLAVVTEQGRTKRVCVWELLSWTPVRCFSSDLSSDPSALLFAPRGESLFVGYRDSSILEWDLTGRRGQARPAPDAKRLESLWESLGEPAASAYPAVWEFADHPASSVPFLRERVKPADRPAPEMVRKLIDQLSSDAFRTREDAAKRLIAMQEPVLGALEEERRRTDSEELKTRLDKIARTVRTSLSPEVLRSLRAVTVLEWVGGKEAAELIDRLAKGDESARLTQAARAAQKRLK